MTPTPEPALAPGPGAGPGATRDQAPGFGAHVQLVRRAGQCPERDPVTGERVGHEFGQ
ncbi:MAG: hypothetical protein AB7V44_28340 [Pseudonocardia sp.]